MTKSQCAPNGFPASRGVCNESRVSINLAFSNFGFKSLLIPGLLLQALVFPGAFPLPALRRWDICPHVLEEAGKTQPQKGLDVCSHYSHALQTRTQGLKMLNAGESNFHF